MGRPEAMTPSAAERSYRKHKYNRNRCFRKRRFDSQSAALKHARFWEKKKGEDLGKEQYYCETCFGWHNGAKVSEKIKAEIRQTNIRHCVNLLIDLQRECPKSDDGKDYSEFEAYLIDSGEILRATKEKP